MARRAGISLEEVGYLGPRFTFTYLAARKILEKYGSDMADADGLLQEMRSNTQVIGAVAEGGAKYGVVPILNLIGGRPDDVVDALYRRARSEGVMIADSLVLPISTCIGGRCDSSQVAKVASKDVALHQCSEHIRQNYPGAEWVPVDSTVRGMQLIASGDAAYEFAAALGPKEGLDEFGLNVYAEDIANSRPNKTRFLLLTNGKTNKEIRLGKSRSGVQDITTVAVTPLRAYRDLADDLSKLADDCGIVQKNHYTRPTGWDSEIVFLDLAGHRSDPNVKNFLGRLSAGSLGNRTEYLVLGSYPFDDFFEPRIRNIGVIEGRESLNKLLVDFYKTCGYSVHSSDGNEHVEHLARRSDVIVINRPGRYGLKATLSRMKEHLDEDKLVVFSSSHTDAIREELSEIGLKARVMFMDAPIAKKAPLKGQNVMFIGDVKLEPGTLEWEFIGMYEDKDMNVTFTDFDTHRRYRGFASQVPTLLAAAYLKMAEASGIDFRRLGDFASPSERIIADALQKIASGDRDVIAKSLKRYLGQNPDMIGETAEWLAGMPAYTTEEIGALIRDAVKASNDIEGATRRITGFYPHMYSWEDI